MFLWAEFERLFNGGVRLDRGLIKGLLVLRRGSGLREFLFSNGLLEDLLGM